jgi:hypothetical protein
VLGIMMKQVKEMLIRNKLESYYKTLEEIEPTISYYEKRKERLKEIKNEKKLANIKLNELLLKDSDGKISTLSSMERELEFKIEGKNSGAFINYSSSTSKYLIEQTIDLEKLEDDIRELKKDPFIEEYLKFKNLAYQDISQLEQKVNLREKKLQSLKKKQIHCKKAILKLQKVINPISSNDDFVEEITK